MTLDQMRIVTKTQLAQLHPLTKRELIAYARNQITIIVGNADLMVEAARNEEDLDGALTIAKTGRKFLNELEMLFAERAPETIGAEEKPCSKS